MCIVAYMFLYCSNVPLMTEGTTRSVMLSLMLASLPHIATSTAYTVIPDLDYLNNNITCHNCYNLEHCLLNSTKYFTSNTQMLFRSRQHQLYYNLIIQYVYNISLIGDATSETIIHTTKLYAYVLMIRLTIKNFVILSSLRIPTFYKWVPLTIKDCSSVALYHLQLYQTPSRINYHYSLVAINIMNNSYFSHIECSLRMQLIYNETQTDMKHHVLSMRNCTANSMQLIMLQNSYKVTLKIMDTQVHYIMFETTTAINNTFIYAEELGGNEVLINNCQLITLYMESNC